jgi:hypothetical protein
VDNSPGNISFRVDFSRGRVSNDDAIVVYRHGRT